MRKSQFDVVFLWEEDMEKHLVGKADLFVFGYKIRVIETNLAFACFHNSCDLMDRFLGIFIDFFENFLQKLSRSAGFNKKSLNRTWNAASLEINCNAALNSCKNEEIPAQKALRGLGSPAKSKSLELNSNSA